MRAGQVERIMSPPARQTRVPWHCLECRGALGRTAQGLHCAACSINIAVVDGVPDFLPGHQQGFDEDRAARFHNPKHVPWRYTLKRRVAQFFADDNFSTNLQFHRQVMREPGLILDVGCGAGNGYYPQVGHTVGIDPAWVNIAMCRALYPQLGRALGDRLPFADDTFDYVATTDVLEHIPLHKKDAAIREMARVLKPGGRMVHVFPLDDVHPLTRFAKSDPALYKRHFIDEDGHVGIEMGRGVLARFERAGLRIVRTRVQNGAVWSKTDITKRFGNEYVDRSKRVRALVETARFISARRLLNHAVNPLWWSLDRVITPFLGIDYVSRLGVCAEKPARASAPTSFASLSSLR